MVGERWRRGSIRNSLVDLVVAGVVGGRGWQEVVREGVEWRVVLDARVLTVEGKGLGLGVEVCVAAAVGIVGGGIVVVVVVGLEALVG